MNVHIYSVGFVALSVCHPTNMNVDEVTDYVNQKHPTGLDHGWFPSTDETFATGEPQPGPCEQDPQRIHRLYNC